MPVDTQSFMGMPVCLLFAVSIYGQLLCVGLQSHSGAQHRQGPCPPGALGLSMGRGRGSSITPTIRILIVGPE